MRFTPKIKVVISEPTEILIYLLSPNDSKPHYSVHKWAENVNDEWIPAIIRPNWDVAMTTDRIWAGLLTLEWALAIGEYLDIMIRIGKNEKKADELLDPIIESLENKRQIVIMESPYAGDVSKNIDYARKCLKACLLANETPFASHLLFTQDGVLRDDIPVERKMGIDAGLEMQRRADKVVVFIDLGITEGMNKAINMAIRNRVPIEYRELDGEGFKVIKDGTLT